MSSFSIATVVLLCALALPARAGQSPSYTNEDLDRVAPFRGETGVDSTPAFRPVASTEQASSARGGSTRRTAVQGEDYWRREAQRVRERQRRFDDQLEALRRTLEKRRAHPGAMPHSDSQVRESERRIAELQRRRAELESDLDDRARRARALPGWLR